MNKLYSAGIVVVLFAVLVAIIFDVVPIPVGATIEYQSSDTVTEILPTAPPKHAVAHKETPEAVKALYISACGAASNTLRTHVVDLLDTTEANSIIIDIKDYTGSVAFITDTIDIHDGEGCRVADMKEFIADLHERDIYVIGRITVFQDPLYTKRYPERAVQSKSRPGEPWEDYKGLSFVEVAATPFWDYIVDIAEASHDIGFDELNFDYIRYPSDGPMADAVYTHAKSSRADELEKFFRYLRTNVHKADASGHVPVMSADIFGMTTTNYDDLTIGQVLERALPYFDYIAPMVYPSHYPSGFIGLSNPNTEVYKVIKYAMDSAVERAVATTTPVVSFAHTPLTTINETGEEVAVPDMYVKKAYDPTVLRPWLQDFDYGGDYGVAEVRAQIQATYDAGLDSWMLWDPSNRYTRGALQPQAE